MLIKQINSWEKATIFIYLFILKCCQCCFSDSPIFLLRKFNFNTISQIKIPDIPHISWNSIPLLILLCLSAKPTYFQFSSFFLSSIVLYKCWSNHGLSFINNIKKLFCPFSEGRQCLFHGHVSLDNQTHKSVLLRTKPAQSLSFLLPICNYLCLSILQLFFYHIILKCRASLITAKSCMFCSFTAVIHMLEWQWQENIILTQVQNEKL